MYQVSHIHFLDTIINFVFFHFFSNPTLCVCLTSDILSPFSHNNHITRICHNLTTFLKHVSPNFYFRSSNCNFQHCIKQQSSNCISLSQAVVKFKFQVYIFTNFNPSRFSIIQNSANFNYLWGGGDLVYAFHSIFPSPYSDIWCLKISKQTMYIYIMFPKFLQYLSDSKNFMNSGSFPSEVSLVFSYYFLSIRY